MVYKNDTESFYIKEHLVGDDRDIVAQQEKITFTFYDSPPDSVDRIP